jgi:hypothetical protein
MPTETTVFKTESARVVIIGNKEMEFYLYNTARMNCHFDSRVCFVISYSFPKSDQKDKQHRTEYITE